MGEEPARRADYRSVLRLTERIHQRQFGAVIDAGRIHERLCLEGWLARMAGPGVSDGTEIGAADSAQMKRGGRIGFPFGLLTSPELDAGFVFLPGRWGLYKVRATDG